MTNVTEPRHGERSKSLRFLSLKSEKIHPNQGHQDVGHLEFAFLLLPFEAAKEPVIHDKKTLFSPPGSCSASWPKLGAHGRHHDIASAQSFAA
jgi:hypothetical protein